MKIDLNPTTDSPINTLATIITMQIKRGVYFKLATIPYENEPPNKKGGGFVTSKTSTTSE
jgi:hypothetical protein